MFVISYGSSQVLVIRRRHWPEYFGRVKRTFCFSGAIDVLQGAVVRRPISAQPGFLFLLLKNISLHNFLNYF